MATAVDTYSSARTLLTFLEDRDETSQQYALERLTAEADYLWHELIDHLESL